jgi:hypothetical protein
MKMELLRLRFDEQVRSEKRKSAGTAIESAAASNLKPWTMSLLLCYSRMKKEPFTETTGLVDSCAAVKSFFTFAQAV